MPRAGHPAAGGSSCLAARSASVEHSKHIAERFRAAGIAAEYLDGATATAERDAIRKRLAAGTTRVVTDCNCLSEGFDLLREHPSR